MQKSFKNYYLAAAILLFAFTACNNEKQAPATDTRVASTSNFDLSAAKSTIEQNNQGFIDDLAKGDSTAIAARYSSDAKLLPDGGPEVSGADKIKSMWGGFARMANLKLEVVDVWGNENLLAEEGRYVMTDKEGKELDKGKYLVIWKQENGQWKMFRDIWNSNGKLAAK